MAICVAARWGERSASWRSPKPAATGNERLKTVTIHTDGGCAPNPGPGGYGVVLGYGKHRKELSGGYRLTTNNRMELMAAIVALEALKAPCRVTLHSDSRYLVEAMNEHWPERWRANGWRRGDKSRAKNPDLWERLLAAAARHRVRFVWVPAHTGIADNERCDELAREAMRRSDLAVDEMYERGIENAPADNGCLAGGSE